MDGIGKMVGKMEKLQFFQEKIGVFGLKKQRENYVQKTEKGSDRNYVFFCIQKEKATGKTYNFSESRLTK